MATSPNLVSCESKSVENMHSDLRGLFSSLSLLCPNHQQNLGQVQVDITYKCKPAPAGFELCKLEEHRDRVRDRQEKPQVVSQPLVGIQIGHLHKNVESCEVLLWYGLVMGLHGESGRRQGWNMVIVMSGSSSRRLNIFY